MADGRIQDNQITAGSTYDNNSKDYGPGRARLNQTGGYRAMPNSNQAFLSVHFFQPMIITGIATQGYSNLSVEEWVKKFLMGYTYGSTHYFKARPGGSTAKVCGFFLQSFWFHLSSLKSKVILKGIELFLDFFALNNNEMISNNFALFAD